MAAGRAVPWLAATLAWMLMMLAETANGFVREVFVAPAIGAHRARQAGILAGCVLVLSIAWSCARWLRTDAPRGQLLIGGYWVGLTVVFEILLGQAMDLSWSRIVSDYDPTRGGLMLLGLAVMFVAPMLTARRAA